MTDIFVILKNTLDGLEALEWHTDQQEARNRLQWYHDSVDGDKAFHTYHTILRVPAPKELSK